MVCAVKDECYWLSFVKDGVFVGACIVKAISFLDAVNVATTKKLNPGGEVKVVKLRRKPPDKIINIMLDKQQAELAKAIV